MKRGKIRKKVATTQRLSPPKCRLKAEEAKALSKRVKSPAAKVMLKHIAETWRRVAREVERRFAL
jgi:hypothetical protein